VFSYSNFYNTLGFDEIVSVYDCPWPVSILIRLPNNPTNTFSWLRNPLNLPNVGNFCGYAKTESRKAPGVALQNL